MDDIKCMIGLEIKKLRKEQKISQEKLAELSDLHPTYIGQIERGEKNASVDVLIRILSSLNVNMCDFFSLIDIYKQSTQTSKNACLTRLLHMNEIQLQALIKIADIIHDMQKQSSANQRFTSETDG